MHFLDNIFKFKNGLTINGLTKELNCFYVLKLFELKNENIIIVTNSLYEANNMFNSLQTYTDKVLLFPMDDFLTSVIVAESPELKLTRLETLKELKKTKNIIVTNLTGYLKYLPSVSSASELTIDKEQRISRNEIIKHLDNFGYRKETYVTSTGEYAVRGFIIDVFALNETNPFRIELSDNCVDSIRVFDESNQKSIKEVDTVSISSLLDSSKNKESSLINYASSIVVFIDYDQIEASYYKLEQDIFEYKTSHSDLNVNMYSLKELTPNYVTYLNTFGKDNPKDGYYIKTSQINNYNMNLNKLKSDVEGYKRANKKVLICCSKQKQIDELKKLDIDAKIVNKKINNGFIVDDIVVIGENDIEMTRHDYLKYKNNYRFGKRIKDYSQLDVGDYVVHVAHGIGIYNGLVSLTKNGVVKDYLQILYADNDKIYVPVEKITTIYKYGDKEGTAPKINKLNSSAWIRTREYVRSKVKDISLELMELYKERLNINNEPYIKYPEQEVFNNAFSYELTKDQEKSINDILNDLETSHPMDRLLCGDVGFGKTEVAFRAMFDAVLNNKQVMYLCPTTILSKQQYEVALKRFETWPVNIEVLNRFVSKKESNRIIEGLKTGKVDIVFGTHRLLSDDIGFKNLDLLIVDEEQRFGVAHKEKIKKLKKDVNVLTLSATPIPRTLKLALSGIRDLSIIDTPPIDRYPVQTYVIKEDDLVLRDAIYKELSRHGQTFILYNRIDNLEKMVYKFQKMIPEAKIGYAHGQMGKDELENIMSEFIEGNFDILMCTTIIESGIDIPNVNTLIIYEADKFGLSQLYQIRGRVGRSNRIAYCYLLYEPTKILNEFAVKRLEAIKEFTELGSGYKIAMRDLSIRGAGDIFGASQAGFVDAVGMSLYMKMMDDEIKRQKNEYVEEDIEQNQALLNVETHISDKYVYDEDVKIEIHQRINEITDENKFKEIKAELEDRFGQIDDQLEVYMYEEWFEALASKYNIKKVTQTDRLVQIEFPPELSENIEGDKLLMSAFQISRSFNLKYENKRIIITLYYKNLEKHFVYYLVKLLNDLELKNA